jgi:hypothetical protein
MMKRVNQIFGMLIILAVAVCTLSCERNEELLLNPATEKIDHAFVSYDSILNSSSSGWKMVVFPDIIKNPCD